MKETLEDIIGNALLPTLPLIQKFIVEKVLDEVIEEVYRQILKETNLQTIKENIIKKFAKIERT